MREVHDVPLTSWMPPEYVVDSDGKVEGATPGKVHNWGRWGANDQLGTANLLTPERRVAAAALVRSGRTVSLGLPVGGHEPNPGTRSEILHFFRRTTADHLLGDTAAFDLQTSDDVVFLPLQGSTQLDGHAHFAKDDVLYNGYWAGLVTAQSGARRLGIHNQAGGIVGRGVLLDIPSVEDIDPFGAQIGPELLERAEQAASLTVGAGDIVLVRTGFLGAWLANPDQRNRRRQAGLTHETATWLASRDVAMVAADNRTVESIPASDGHAVLSFHVAALRDLGLLLGELFDLDELARACAEERRHEFLFAAMPFPLVNGVGSPLNPLAMF